MTFKSLDAVLYINLSHRQDRNNHIIQELERLNVHPSQIYKIEGEFDIFNGHRGCAKSHIKALSFALEKGFKKFLILEDDATFVCKGDFIDSMLDEFFALFHGWDVFLLGGNVMIARETKEPSIKQILYSQSCHAYITCENYAKKLINCFESALMLMEDDLDYLESQQRRHSIDHAWKKLQTQDRWYINKVAAQQRYSYSDITGTVYESFFEDVGTSSKTLILKETKI